MQISKIGSKNTYHKCIRLLHETEYIIYHPPLSKFQPVKISIRKLDVQHQERSFKQLEISFSPPSGGRGVSINSDTVQVSKLTDVSTDSDTDTVPKVGQYIKQNNKTVNSVLDTPTKIFDKNRKIQDGINSFIQQDQTSSAKANNNRLRVSKSVHESVTLRHSKSDIPKQPSLEEVEIYFKQNNYPVAEARKFFLYNQSKNWMLTDKIPIYDWKTLSAKWMLNVKEDSTQEPAIDPDKDLQYLYRRFLEGHHVSKHILPEYCDHLNLQVSDQVKAEAIQRRINQLMGTNIHSESQLWQAYKGEIQNENIILKDQPTLIALTKRLTVFKYFQQLNREGKTCIP